MIDIRENEMTDKDFKRVRKELKAVGFRGGGVKKFIAPAKMFKYEFEMSGIKLIVEFCIDPNNGEHFIVLNVAAYRRNLRQPKYGGDGDEKLDKFVDVYLKNKLKHSSYKVLDISDQSVLSYRISIPDKKVTKTGLVYSDLDDSLRFVTRFVKDFEKFYDNLTGKGKQRGVFKL